MFFASGPLRGFEVGGELGKVKGLVARAEVSLHELSSSTDIEKALRFHLFLVFHSMEAKYDGKNNL